MIQTSSSEQLHTTVDTFWETFPPFWRRVRAHIRQVASDQFDLSVAQFHILRHIRAGLGTVSELAEARYISRPAVSQAVDILVNRGLVDRSRDPNDRRQVRLVLTDAGSALMDAISADTRQWMVQILSPLGDEALEHLVQGMQALRQVQTP